MKKENLMNLSMLILRLSVGTIFMMHGAQKLFGMFNGIGLEGTSKMIEGLGVGKPFLVAVIWGSVEFIGGIFLIFGMLARWAAACMVLAVCIYLWRIGLVYGLSVQSAGMEYNLLIVGSCAPLILMGGGSWSVWDA